MSASEPASFPADDSLCEACGYQLRGLERTGDCPECGRAIALSDPVHRSGLPWQRRRTFLSLLQTYKAIITSPRAAFDAMIVPVPVKGDGQDALGNKIDRVPLYLVALLSGAISYQAFEWLGHRDGGHMIFAPLLLILLTYTEALGVTYFARKRGWRVPFRLAERIVCYASIGWLPAMIVLPPLIILQGQTPFLPAWASWIPLRGELTDWLLIAIVGGVTSLWFESLVWLGVRRLRFANSLA